MTRSNDFSDQRLYRLQCVIPRAMAGIRDSAGKAPAEVKRFFLDKLKFNDNSNNQVCSISNCAILMLINTVFRLLLCCDIDSGSRRDFG